MTEQEKQQLQEEIATLQQALVDVENVSNAVRSAGEELLPKASNKDLKRIIRRILTYPKLDGPKVVNDVEGALTQAIFEKMKIIQQQLTIISQIAKREEILNNKETE